MFWLRRQRSSPFVYSSVLQTALQQASMRASQFRLRTSHVRNRSSTPFYSRITNRVTFASGCFPKQSIQAKHQGCVGAACFNQNHSFELTLVYSV
ncbi:hypothetical protein K505DRAFT_104560 [Melanomma pulvis-pyrius CBS 109.77]|uniref:Uncharacterized protein n=1 Tax=Melanomma pulvis-pyrius CBS 109.77 TaxID=1314802 RepID=A0A6A6WXR8_9PLEO|nr:hypothetical protein K505DRAFT_104560 [Melanomma pulvis-pyrius CBS 109.77]